MDQWYQWTNAINGLMGKCHQWTNGPMGKPWTNANGSNPGQMPMDQWTIAWTIAWTNANGTNGLVEWTNGLDGNGTNGLDGNGTNGPAAPMDQRHQWAGWQWDQWAGWQWDQWAGWF